MTAANGVNAQRIQKFRSLVSDPDTAPPIAR